MVEHNHNLVQHNIVQWTLHEPILLSEEELANFDAKVAFEVVQRVTEEYHPESFMKVAGQGGEGLFSEVIDGYFKLKGEYKILWVFDRSIQDFTSYVSLVELKEDGVLSYNYWLTVPGETFDKILGGINNLSEAEVIVSSSTSDQVTPEDIEKTKKLEQQVEDEVNQLLRQAGYENTTFDIQLTPTGVGIVGVARGTCTVLDQMSQEEIKEMSRVTETIWKIIQEKYADQVGNW